jgi:GDPmannose 4,6-dehydratase
MLQQDTPEDYVIASGETKSVREFVEKAFLAVDIPIKWEGSGISEKGINTLNNEVIIEIDAQYFRPTEVDILHGDPAKAVKNLGWTPRKTSFDQLVKIMVKHDLEYVKNNGVQYG